MEVEQLLDERGRTHGDFRLHAEITQDLKSVIYGRIASTPTPTQREALEMILHKIGRIAAGDPNFVDHWDDIAGYAKLVANELRGK
jgi:hypothetical protein